MCTYAEMHKYSHTMPGSVFPMTQTPSSPPQLVLPCSCLHFPGLHAGRSCYSDLTPRPLLHPCRHCPWASDLSSPNISSLHFCRSSDASNPACQFGPRGPSILSASLCISGIRMQPLTCPLLPTTGHADQLWQHSHPKYAPQNRCG